jgi:hypothetical protein
VTLASGEQIAADHVVLAVGHSARDTFEMLHAARRAHRAKPFSVGFRIEHPQSLIDQARFGKFAGHPLLGAADYKLVHHAATAARSTASACARAARWWRPPPSPARRHQRHEPVFAQRTQRQRRHGGRHHPRGLSPAARWPASNSSASWEEAAFGRRRQLRRAGQLVGDFLAGRPPPNSARRAVLHAGRAISPTCRPACRTTRSPPSARPCPPSTNRSAASTWPMPCSPASRRAPPRRCASPAATDCQSLNTRGLYPAGEGAGYAGGILSAAVDGIEVAEAVALPRGGGATPRCARRPEMRRGRRAARRRCRVQGSPRFQCNK